MIQSAADIQVHTATCSLSNSRFEPLPLSNPFHGATCFGCRIPNENRHEKKASKFTTSDCEMYKPKRSTSFDSSEKTDSLVESFWIVDA